jgi:hypothetical protein
VAGHQPQPSRGHDAERALAAAEQSSEVVAGVVLDEAAEVRDHRAVGEHGLHAQQLRARGAEADHACATGVGGHAPADRRRVAGAPVDAVLPSGGPSGGLHGGDRRARTGGELPGVGVDVDDGVERPQ